MMTLANYGIGSSKHKDPNSAKALNKSLQIRNRAETSLKHCLKTHYRIPDDKRIEILNGIKEYYSRVPFKVVIWNKYQTGQCIVDSILLLDSKFNPYKALEAFKAVERMLINLVHLPWHKEFRRIFTYSGLFRLMVSDPLIGVEEIFKAAGFKEESNDQPMHLVLTDDKMPQTDDGESVTSVIFDCLIAQVVMMNIIDIFENCCKASKQPGDHLKSEVNCYSWIQTYFRERSLQTTEIACSNIQELLNNITNHLSRFEFSAIKSGPKQQNELLSGSQSSEMLNHKSSNSLNEQRHRDSSPILSAQERTRKFLAQQPIEDENLLKLSDDILRPPQNESTTTKKMAQRPPLSDYTGSGSKLSSRSNDYNAATSAPEVQRNNGYPSNVHHRQEGPSFSASNRSVSKLSQSNDTIDSQRGNDFGSQRSVTDRDLLGHPVRVDLPHNDRELLIPKQDRASVNQLQYQEHQLNLNSFDQHEYDRHQMNHNHHNHQQHHNEASNYQSGPQSRNHLYDRPSYYDDIGSSSSHHHNHYHNQQYSSSNNPVNKRLTSKYGNAKYESRSGQHQANNQNNNLTHSRSYWSCGSCTFNNQVDSEICEMCRNRRSSR